MKIYHLYAVLLVVALSVVSSCDYNIQLQNHRTYCEMVEQGLWPDYEEIYSTTCNPSTNLRPTPEETFNPTGSEASSSTGENY